MYTYKKKKLIKKKKKTLKKKGGLIAIPALGGLTLGVGLKYLYDHYSNNLNKDQKKQFEDRISEIEDQIKSQYKIDTPLNLKKSRFRRLREKIYRNITFTRLIEGSLFGNNSDGKIRRKLEETLSWLKEQQESIEKRTSNRDKKIVELDAQLRILQNLNKEDEQKLEKINKSYASKKEYEQQKLSNSLKERLENINALKIGKDIYDQVSDYLNKKAEERVKEQKTVATREKEEAEKKIQDANKKLQDAQTKEDDFNRLKEKESVIKKKNKQLEAQITILKEISELEKQINQIRPEKDKSEDLKNKFISLVRELESKKQKLEEIQE